MKKMLLAALLSLALSPALAQDEDCKQVIREMEAKMKAAGQKDFYLFAIDPDKVKNAKVVGECAGGTKKIIYQRS